MDDNPIFVEWDRYVQCTTDLHVRHGNMLTFRNITWYVSVQDMSEPLLGSPFLEVLGLNTKHMLIAASDKYDRDAYIAEELAEGSIACFLHQGVFHSGREFSEDVSDDKEVGINLDEDDSEEKKAALMALQRKCKGSGISDIAVR